MNYTTARSKFVHKAGIERNHSDDPIKVRKPIRPGSKIVVYVPKLNSERKMAGKVSMASPAVKNKPGPTRAKRARLNPGRRTVEQNRRAR